MYRRDVELLVESVPALLSRTPPLDALRTWFETLADYIRVKHGLGEALHSAAVQDAIDETYAPVVAAVAVLLEACVADGSLRSGLDPADVLLVMGFMWRVGADEVGRAQARRVMEMVIDGLRPSATATAGTPGP